ncbi:hypothetical protein B0A52_08234 [Exophiala mesophila]|uniref:Ubiquitin-like protease family profile domain-containing protein n=1 Tax=Exophiala mesophila TaxID=212818 RepID=A0A438MYR7_EXOME|nr:hypothetical protein B0A52_08234 [Exophiala mesophila]
MADFSSFMDWAPATPPPTIDPYPEDYIPGGWVDNLAIPAAGVFARSAPEGFLPKAKRLCFGLAQTTQYLANIAATPLYCIVRRVRKQQLIRFRRSKPRQTLSPKISHHAPQLPSIAQVAKSVAYIPSTDAQTQTTSTDSIHRHTPAQYHTLPTSTVNTTRVGTRSVTQAKKIYYTLPKLEDFLQPVNQPLSGLKRRRDSTTDAAQVSRKSKFAKRPHSTMLHPQPVSGRQPDNQTQEAQGAAEVSEATANDIISSSGPPLLLEQQQTTSTVQTTESDGILGTIHFTPPPEDPPQQVKTPQARPRSQPLPVGSLNQSFPVLRPISPPSETDINAQREENEKEDDSDSDDDYLLHAERMLRIGSPPIRTVQTRGTRSAQTAFAVASRPSAQPTITYTTSSTSPTPPIVVHGEASPLTLSSDDALEESLLSPLRIKARRATTPKPTNSISPTSQKTPESDISSAWEVSPRDMLPIELILSPCAGRSSSSQDISPPSHEIAMPASGGGSPAQEAIITTKDADCIAKSGQQVPDEAVLTTETREANEDVSINSTETLSKPPETVKSTPLEGVTPATEEDLAETSSIAKLAESGANTPELSATSDSPAQTDGQTAPTTPVRIPIQAFRELDLGKDFDSDLGTPKANIHSAQKSQRVTRAESKRLEALKQAQTYAISPLAEEWNPKIEKALRHGIKGYQATDLTRVVPLTRTDSTSSWLNDEVINGYLELIVKHGNQNDRPTQKIPSLVTFNSFFYSNLNSKGYDGVRRWSSRKKIGGKALLETEYVFIPINLGAHWTLCVVSGKNKTITHYNSLGRGGPYVGKVLSWVQQELGSAFREEEWTLEADGQSPQQTNMNDCGVFTITSARQIMLGMTPMSYDANDIPLQRRRIVAELINEGLIQSL